MTGCTKTNSSEYSTVAGQACTTGSCKKGELRLGVFFDGTGNDARNPIEYSNVKKLFDVYPVNKYSDDKFKTVHSAYVRGVGSRKDTFQEWGARAHWYSLSGTVKPEYGADKNYDTDGTPGGAWGAGGHARIDGMLFLLQKAIGQHKESCGFLPKNISLDVFGFSRGAIQARHFVNVIKQGFYKLDGEYKDYEPSDFTIKTLNIFDSVSSFEILTVATPGTPQDPGWAFNIAAGMVNQIIHLVADDEYRQNFDGQVINGSQDLDYPQDITGKSLTELVFLGAHSDIGGGYRPVHHGRNNNHLAKIYLNKMYELAEQNQVPFTGKGGGWDIPDKLNDSFEDIQDKYEKYPKLKVEHKKFRERMGYLYDPGSNKHPAYQLPEELSQNIEANKIEIAKINTELTKLEAQLKKASGSQDSYLLGLVTVTKGDKEVYQSKITEAENRRSKLQRINRDYTKKLTAYHELKKAFAGNETDYQDFLTVSVDFHNTYVHKSHSGMYQWDRSDYDAQGNEIAGRSRDTAGMNAEIDGGIIFDGHVHRKWYYAKSIDVVKALCEREQIEKTNAEVFDGFFGTIADYATRPGRWVASKAGLTEEYTAFDWATPKEFS